MDWNPLSGQVVIRGEVRSANSSERTEFGGCQGVLRFARAGVPAKRASQVLLVPLSGKD